MSVAQQISEETYERIVWSEPDRKLELHDGHLVEKPGVTWNHGRIEALLCHFLLRQLDFETFAVVVNDWRVRRPPGSVFIPDIVVVSTEYGQEFVNHPDKLAIFSQPLPLVVEVWSRSTGEYGVDAKLPVYQQRGDLEIWRIHPYERTLTAWRRQPDGSYEESVYGEGIVQPVALPNVAIDLAELFRR